MSLLTYTMTVGSETRTTELRRSNPQGWLSEAVREAFPEVSARRGTDLIRLRLQRVIGMAEAWQCTLSDTPCDLVIKVVKSKK